MCCSIFLHVFASSSPAKQTVTVVQHTKAPNFSEHFFTVHISLLHAFACTRCIFLQQSMSNCQEVNKWLFTICLQGAWNIASYYTTCMRKKLNQLEISWACFFTDPWGNRLCFQIKSSSIPSSQIILRILCSVSGCTCRGGIPWGSSRFFSVVTNGWSRVETWKKWTINNVWDWIIPDNDDNNNNNASHDPNMLPMRFLTIDSVTDLVIETSGDALHANHQEFVWILYWKTWENTVFFVKTCVFSCPK